jgi:hypothetical protein
LLPSPPADPAAPVAEDGENQELGPLHLIAVEEELTAGKEEIMQRQGKQ